MIGEWNTHNDLIEFYEATGDSTTRFNNIGFGNEFIIEYKHCPLGPGVRLLKVKGELKCPTCGYNYKKEEAPNEESIKIKHDAKTAIVSPKRKKWYLDQQGNEINDETLIQDIQQGANVISYHEELPT